MEFGRPHLEVRGPAVSKSSSLKVRRLLARRHVFVHGQWHLWIYCCAWEVLSNGKHIANGATKAGVRRAAKLLDGQKLVRFSYVPRKNWCVFEFDLAATLRTKPYDRKSEQWKMSTPKGKVLILRADKRYKYMRSDLPGNRGEWKPALP